MLFFDLFDFEFLSQGLMCPVLSLFIFPAPNFLLYCW
jgi:hypothetical protein